MSERERPKDLVCLVPDRDIEETMRSLLGRHRALGIRPISFDLLVHPEHDPGCRSRSADLLRRYLQRCNHALVVFDRDGCGSEHQDRTEIEEDLEEDLCKNGWQDRAAAVVIDPEVEAWVWSPSSHVDAVLGWKDRSPDLRTWLVEYGYLDAESEKPGRPKEALDEAIKTIGKPHSSSLFRQLAAKVSITKCSDPAFAKLRGTLEAWFPST